MRKDKGFTLIELLVVISVIALLMAILMPALQRVNSMAKAVVCRSNLRQWGLWYSMYTNDHDDKFFGYHGGHIGSSDWIGVMRPYYKDSNDVLLCPMAIKHKCERHLEELGGSHYQHSGNRFSSWTAPSHIHSPVFNPRSLSGSYGLNAAVLDDRFSPDQRWRTPLVKSPGDIPVFLDSTGRNAGRRNTPPPYEDMMHRFRSPTSCINRHDGYVNGLFMDWTVRRVGLKELWTLKWHPDYDTANEWTIAGGVTLDDWPDWMRGFKDY